jgi:hypothetical protein
MPAAEQQPAEHENGGYRHQHDHNGDRSGSRSIWNWAARPKNCIDQ